MQCAQYSDKSWQCDLYNTKESMFNLPWHLKYSNLIFQNLLTKLIPILVRCMAAMSMAFGLISGGILLLGLDCIRILESKMFYNHPKIIIQIRIGNNKHLIRTSNGLRFGRWFISTPNRPIMLPHEYIT